MYRLSVQVRVISRPLSFLSFTSSCWVSVSVTFSSAQWPAPLLCCASCKQFLDSILSLPHGRKAASPLSGHTLENVDLHFAACLCTINSNLCQVSSRLFLAEEWRLAGLFRNAQRIWECLRESELKYKKSNRKLFHLFYCRSGCHCNFEKCMMAS